MSLQKPRACHSLLSYKLHYSRDFSHQFFEQPPQQRCICHWHCCVLPPLWGFVYQVAFCQAKSTCAVQHCQGCLANSPKHERLSTGSAPYFYSRPGSPSHCSTAEEIGVCRVSLQAVKTHEANRANRVMSFILICPATQSRLTFVRLLKNHSLLTILQVSEFILGYMHTH